MMIDGSKLMAFIPTSNFVKARAFYEGVLGLKFLSEDGFALVMESSGTMVRIAKVGKFSPAQFTILGWQVDDIASAVTWLGTKGVKFEHFPGLQQDDLGIWSAPGGAKVAWFKDPEGNILSLSEHPH
jgi:catechol 2,3-dioxygenase-like lactoylglutathione lyase family enzyme